MLQQTGTFTQPVTLTVSGVLQVSFYAAQRENYQTSYQTFEVSLGSLSLGTFNPSGTSYESLTTAPMFLPAGTYDLTFTGLSSTGDNTAFLDDVQIAFTPASGGNSVADNPFGYLGGLGYWQDPALADSGLSYVRQRWLENASGQWLSVDTVASEPRYGYAHNSPTMRADSDGTQAYPPYDGRNQSAYLNAYLDGVFQGFVAHATDPATYTAPFDRFEIDVAGHLSALEAPWRFMCEGSSEGLTVVEQKIFNFLHIQPITAKQYIRFRSNLGVLGGLLCIPHYGEPSRIAFDGGLIWGMFETAVKMGAHTPGDIVRLGIDLIKNAANLVNRGIVSTGNKIGGDITDFINSTYQSFIVRLGKLCDLKPYDRGKIIGIMAASAIALYLGGKGIVELPSALTEFLDIAEAKGISGPFSGIPESFTSRPSDFERSITTIANREGGFGTGSLLNIVKEPKGPISDSLRSAVLNEISTAEFRAKFYRIQEMLRQNGMKGQLTIAQLQDIVENRTVFKLNDKSGNPYKGGAQASAWPNGDGYLIGGSLPKDNVSSRRLFSEIADHEVLHLVHMELDPLGTERTIRGIKYEVIMTVYASPTVLKTYVYRLAIGVVGANLIARFIIIPAQNWLENKYEVNDK